MKSFNAVILAAGYGKRLQSNIPKVLNLVREKKMIDMVVDATINANADRVVVVVGYKGQEVIAALEDKPVEFAYQKVPCGTGDALKSAEAMLKNEDKPIVVLCGDVPLITSQTINKLVEIHIENKAAATILTADIDDPKGYGRILFDNECFKDIIEDIDCTPEQKAIKNVNAGTYCFENKNIWRYINHIPINETSKEYRLTDIFKMLKVSGEKVLIYKTKYPQEIQSVNIAEDLIKINNILKTKINGEIYD